MLNNIFSILFLNILLQTYFSICNFILHCVGCIIVILHECKNEKLYTYILAIFVFKIEKARIGQIFWDKRIKRHLIVGPGGGFLIMCYQICDTRNSGDEHRKATSPACINLCLPFIPSGYVPRR